MFLLNQGYLAGLSYLQRAPQWRYSAQQLLPECVSVIVLGQSYFCATAPESGTANRTCIARYAQGEDYHTVLREKVQQLAEWIQDKWGQFSYKITVDTSPLSEKAYAVAAGLGWRGRNTLTLNRELGSYFFLACLLTDIPLEPDRSAAGSCGSCRRCIDACPTQALSFPGWLDVSKCISYWTTAAKEPVPAGYSLHGWLFGCDICQQVCPYNAAPSQSREPRFAANPALKQLCSASLGALSDTELRDLLHGSVMATCDLRHLRSLAEQCQADHSN